MKNKLKNFLYWFLKILFLKYPIIIFIASLILGFVLFFSKNLPYEINFSLTFSMNILFLFSCSIYWLTVYRFISNQDHVLVPDQYFNLNQTFFWFPVMGLSILNAFFSFFNNDLFSVIEVFFIMIYFSSTAWFTLYSTRFADTVSRDSSKLTTQFNIVMFLTFCIISSFLLFTILVGIVRIDVLNYHYFYIPTAIFSLVIINSLRATIPAISLIKKENQKNTDFALDVTIKKIEKDLITKVSNTILVQAEKDLQNQKKEIISSIDQIAQKAISTHIEANTKKSKEPKLNYGNLVDSSEK